MCPFPSTVVYWFLRYQCSILTTSCLTTSSLPWFMDLTFQVPMQYCSLQHWTLLSPPVQVSSVAQSCPILCNPMNCSTPGLLFHHQLWVLSNTCPLRRWGHPTISSSVVPSSSCLQSFPASGSFLMSQLFTSGGPKYWNFSFNISPSKNTLDWSLLGWTGWISLQFKGFSRVFSTAFQKHQFFSTQLSSQFNAHIHTWPLEKP